MQFAGSEAKIVFRGYALSCLGMRVSNGEMSKKEERELIRGYPLHRLDEDIESRYFPRAVARCAEVAQEMDRNVIDEDAVRAYFRFRHDRHVDKEADAGMIRNRDYCKVWPGKVTEIRSDGHAVVRAPCYKWPKAYRTEFVKTAKKDDFVTIHRSFVSEIIDKETAYDMLTYKTVDPLQFCIFVDMLKGD